MTNLNYEDAISSQQKNEDNSGSGSSGNGSGSSNNNSDANTKSKADNKVEEKDHAFGTRNRLVLL